MTVYPSESISWTNVGAQDSMARTYTAIKNALSRSDNLKNRDIEIFLQGSYANSTNIKDDSDVDIVVMLKSSWVSDKSLLSTQERLVYERDHIKSSYGASELRADIVAALREYFDNGRVELRDKLVRLHKTGGYVDADIVPAIQHRKYIKYDSLTKGKFVEGTRLHPLSGGSIINYPKVHKVNGSFKNTLTNGKFKPSVRQFKRLKKRLVATGEINAKDAPGYLIECLIYNVPRANFGDDHHQRMMSIIHYLLKVDVQEFKSVDGIHSLFVDDPGQFSHKEAKALILKLAQEIV